MSANEKEAKTAEQKRIRAIIEEVMDDLKQKQAEEAADKAWAESDTLISVVVPAYNAEETLERCLDSLLAQNHKALEIICVDDGSTDNTPYLLAKYAAAEPRIRVITKEHSGYGETVNRGFEVAQGEYVGIVESDDVAGEDMFRTLIGMAEKDNDKEDFIPADIVKGNYWDYYFHESAAPEYKLNISHRQLKNGDFTLQKNPEILDGDASVFSAIYRRAFLEKNRLRFRKSLGADRVFAVEVLLKAKRGIWTSKPLYGANRGNTESLSLTMDPAEVYARFGELLDLLKWQNADSHGVRKELYWHITEYAGNLGWRAEHDRNPEQSAAESQRLFRRFDADIVAELPLWNQRVYYRFASSSPLDRANAPKVLIYNWIPYDNPWKWGGGVTVYCANIINEMLKSRPDMDVYFLSSGFGYRANKLTTYVNKLGNPNGERVHQFEILNSPVPAEQRNIYVNPLVALENESLKDVFRQFLKDYGPFDAIHFNNIEGLSLDVLDLKEEFPDTKFIFSIHNYVPLCVNGMYFMRHKHCNCTPDHTGLDCYRCTRADIRKNIAQETYRRGLVGVSEDECVSMTRWIRHFGFDRLDIDVSPDDILQFAQTATAKINKNCDEILAVSKRVYEIAAENGFDESKMSVSYIGTKVAARQIGHAAAEVTDGLKIVHLGSNIDIEEKGYPFMLDALSEMDPAYAAKIDLYLTVSTPRHAEMRRMLKRFRSVTIKQGYTHAELGDIFHGAHLSIVPVVWEDNLPQISIESVAYGVPVLSSTAGGAKELSDSELFQFECGNAEAMRQKIMHFVDHPEDLKEYWSHHHGLVTMQMHWKELARFYGLDEGEENVTFSRENYHYLLQEMDFYKKHYAPEGTPEELKKELDTATAERDALAKKLKKMQEEGYTMKESAKLMFQTDDDPLLGDVGASLFKITLDDFDYSDFYAEIKFVSMGNFAPSYSDVLRISGTLTGEEKKRTITLHQMDWAKGDTPLSQNIFCSLRKNEVTFFAIHNGRSSGYQYEVETLTSRALGETVAITKLHKGFVTENEMRPADAFNKLPGR